MGLVQLTRQSPNSRWLVERDGVSSAIQCIDNYDVSGDGVRDLIVGRSDGGIEVYAYDEGEESEPVLKFANVKFTAYLIFVCPCIAGINVASFQNCGESVTSVEGGVVGTVGYEEIIATTYTGNIVQKCRVHDTHC